MTSEQPTQTSDQPQRGPLEHRRTTTAHLLSVEETLNFYRTDLHSGLTQQQVHARRETFGDNVIYKAYRLPFYIKYLRIAVDTNSSLQSFAVCILFLVFGTSPDIWILWSGVVLFMLQWVLRFVIVFLRIDTKPEFQTPIARTATVKRDGKLVPVNEEQVVLGDIVELRAGDVVPADVRCIETFNCCVEESAITGRDAFKILQIETERDQQDLLKSRNIAFRSTLVVKGKCTAVVIRIGAFTATPELEQIKKGNILLWTYQYSSVRLQILPYCLSLMGFILGMISQHSLTSTAAVFAFIVFIGNMDIDAAVELLILYTRRVIARSANCIINFQSSLIYIAHMSTLLLDSDFIVVNKRYEISKMFYDNEENNSANESNDSFSMMMKAACICSINSQGSGKKSIEEFLRHFCKSQVDIVGLQETYLVQRELKISNNSSVRAILCEEAAQGENRYFMFAMGLAEDLWSCCSTILVDERQIAKEELSSSALSFIHESNLSGNVSFAFGFQVLDDIVYDEHEIADQLCLAGMISLSIYTETNGAQELRKLRNFGIRVIPIFSDTLVTVDMLSKKLLLDRGISRVDIARNRRCFINEVSKDDPQISTYIIDGDELTSMSEEDIKQLLSSNTEVIFLRLLPYQKHLLVKLLKSLKSPNGSSQYVGVSCNESGDVAAMTIADVGITEGITATSVEKETADIIVLDEKMSSLYQAIERSKQGFWNAEKATIFCICSIILLCYPLVVSLALGLSFPLDFYAVPFILCYTIIMAQSFAMNNTSVIESRLYSTPTYSTSSITLNSTLLFVLRIGFVSAYGIVFTFFAVLSGFGFSPSLVLREGYALESATINDGTLITEEGNEYELSSCLIGNLECFDIQSALTLSRSSVLFSIGIFQVVCSILCQSRLLYVKDCHFSKSQCCVLAVTLIAYNIYSFGIFNNNFVTLQYISCFPFVILMIATEEGFKFWRKYQSHASPESE